jgi:mycothiol synthase
MTPIEFARLVARQDGVDAFNEASRLALAHGRTGRVELQVDDGPGIVALAYAVGDAPVELAVHPAHRRRGHGTALLDRLLERGETRFWAHGDTEGARGLAAVAGLQPVRTLLRLSRGLAPDASWPADPGPAVITIRPFRSEDLPTLLAVNARAFASHPEQGAMDQAGFEERVAEEWFDPAGIFVAVRGSEIVGFHWTKIDDLGSDAAVGEVYVLAVDPEHGGRGTGSALLARGLAHLAQAGVRTVELYVEADNDSTLALYRAHGFAEVARDVVYARSS